MSGDNKNSEKVATEHEERQQKKEEKKENKQTADEKEGENKSVRSASSSKVEKFINIRI